MSAWVTSVTSAKHQQPMPHDSLAQLDPSQTVMTVVDRLSGRLLLNKVSDIERALLDLKVLVLTTDVLHGLHDTTKSCIQKPMDILVAVMVKPWPMSCSCNLDLQSWRSSYAAGFHAMDISGGVDATETWLKRRTPMTITLNHLWTCTPL